MVTLFQGGSAAPPDFFDLDEHVSTKINTYSILNGVWGASPPEAEEIFKKSNKIEAFPYFFAFWQGSLNPQNYELAP